MTTAMTRKQLLTAAAKKIGREIPVHVFNYALTNGHVKPLDRRPDGWNLYGPKNVDELVAYVKTRSRSVQVV